MRLTTPTANIINTNTEVVESAPIPDVFFKYDALERQSEISEKKKVVKAEKIAEKTQKKHKTLPGHMMRPIVQPKKVS